MAIRAQNSSDRLRTIWTPEMDRYFIDLMLEQFKKGNRFDDNLFSKRAWKHMTSLFNAKFKFEYEKEVLKNRHKTLRNLYKAVKKLLDQSGFTWDEVRKMVTADNNVWDEYVKIHPGARSFRIKSIPYYSDLCLIYGNSTIDRKGDMMLESSSHSDDNKAIIAAHCRRASEGSIETLRELVTGEDHRISTSEGVVNDVSNSKASRSRTYWQPPMDRYFIDLLLDQVQKGNKVDGVFRRQAWIEMIALFNTKFGFNYDTDVLKNRYKSLRRQYTVINNLLELDGFVWDDMRQMVVADDYVWQYYIKAHTAARQFMTRPVPYYKDLCVICDPATDEVKVYDFQSPVTSVSCEEKDNNVHDSANAGQKKNMRELENLSNIGHRKKSRCEDEGISNALREMASAVSSLSDKKKSDDSSHVISIENVIEAVQSLPDMDEDLVLDACDFLEDEKKAKTFLALDAKLRKKWLTRKLRPQG